MGQRSGMHTSPGVELLTSLAPGCGVEDRSCFSGGPACKSVQFLYSRIEPRLICWRPMVSIGCEIAGIIESIQEAKKFPREHAYQDDD